MAKNWAGNVTFAVPVNMPTSLDELAETVAGSRKVRVLGSGHSFNRIADTDGTLLSVAGLPAVVDVDPAGRTVRVSAGLRYGEVATHLHAAGYALANLGSLPHISVAGACATGTHGSGDRIGNLATAVAGLRLVGADGDPVEIRRGDPGYAGSVVSLGALGVVVELTLDIVPTYEVAQYVFEDLSRAVLDERLESIASAAYSVSLFTDWASDRIDLAMVKHRVGDDGGWPAGQAWFGARPADGPRHPITGLSAVNCTVQGGVPGPWHTRLPHFVPEFVPSSGDELQTEYLVPRERAVEAFAAVERVRDRLAGLLLVSEIRTIAGDDLWLSPAYGRDSVALHFTWRQDRPAVEAALAALEAGLAPLQTRPHWGKLFRYGPETLRERYPRYDDFVTLLATADPNGKFRNAYIDRYFPTR